MICCRESSTRQSGNGERGLKQRIQALNLFIDDIYHDQKILKDRVIPGEIIRSATSFRPSCVSLDPPLGVWCHITGTDLIRDRDGQIYYPNRLRR